MTRPRLWWMKEGARPWHARRARAFFKDPPAVRITIADGWYGPADPGVVYLSRCGRILSIEAAQLRRDPPRGACRSCLRGLR